MKHLLAILLAVSLSGCVSPYKLETSPRASTCLAPPVFYENCAAVRSAFKHYYNAEAKENTCGFYDPGGASIHMPRPQPELPMFELAGHELFHHWFGAFHD